MGWFNRHKTYYKEEMRACLKEFMINYIKEKPSSVDTVMQICSEIDSALQSSSEKDIRKTLLVDSANVEFATLSLIYNVAIRTIQPKDRDSAGHDIIFGGNPAYELCRDVNKIKLDRGYISKFEYDENNIAATMACAISPFGNGTQSMYDIEYKIKKQWTR